MIQNYKKLNSDEVWFLTSELENERASSFRQERWCKLFLKQGYVIRIFNLRGVFSCSDGTCANLQELTSFRDNGIKKYTGPKASVREGKLVRWIRPLKHFFLVDLILPNIIKLYFKLNKILKEKNKSVILMASSPPFSVAVVGALIKKKYGKKIILAIDMRDAWAHHNALGGVKFVKKSIEKWVLNKADHITTVSRGLSDEFLKKYGNPVSTVYNVATHYADQGSNAFDTIKIHVNEIDPSKISLVYTGSTPEKHYDIASLVEGYLSLDNNAPELSRRLQIVFVGACDEVRREVIKQRLRNDAITFVDHIPHSKVKLLQSSATALIFLAHHGENNLGVVSTKLFEYLKIGKPIVPIDLCKGSDVDMLLKRYCGQSVNFHGPAEIRFLFERIAVEGVGWLPKIHDVNQLSELIEDYTENIKVLTGKKRDSDSM